MPTTTKLEALYAVADWMGTYEAGDQGTLATAFVADDAEALSEYPEDMVAGYRLILTQIAAQERSEAIRGAVKIMLKKSPGLDRAFVTRRATLIIDYRIANKTSLGA